MQKKPNYFKLTPGDIIEYACVQYDNIFILEYRYTKYEIYQGRHIKWNIFKVKNTIPNDYDWEYSFFSFNTKRFEYYQEKSRHLLVELKARHL